MKLHEYQAKEIFARYGIPVPQGRVAASAGEARSATEGFGGRAVVKAQVHAGGRGKAGGVKVAQSSDDAETAAQAILSASLVTNQTGPEGVPVNQVLIEELADIAREMYLAITIDRVERRPVMLVSASGGMDIEEVAETSPDLIHAEPIDPVLGLMPFQSRRIARKLGLEGTAATAAPGFLSSLYQVFVDNDCTLVEVNPLIVTGDGRLVALDAKMSVDDDALFRRPAIVELRDQSQEDELEAQAADLDIAYVNLDGDVGCLVNGAGLAMATLDVTSAAGAEPANFLDVGGGATVEKVASAVSHHPVRPESPVRAGQRFWRNPPLRHRRRGHRARLPQHRLPVADSRSHARHQRRRRQTHPRRVWPLGGLRRNTLRGRRRHKAGSLETASEHIWSIPEWVFW